jgi:hypothetical protein
MKTRSRWAAATAIAATILGGLLLFMFQNSTAKKSQSESMAPSEAWTSRSVRPLDSVESEPRSHNVAETRPFVDLSAAERRAFMRSILQFEHRVIFQTMLAAGRVEHDPMKEGAIATTLAQSIRERKPTAGFFAQIREFAINPANPRLERIEVIAVLSNAATRESLELLVDLSTSIADPDIRRVASESVGRVGALRGDGNALSSSLERVWRESSDNAMLVSVASSLAKIGAPSGIELLLASALKSDGRDNRLTAAQSALQEVYLPNAVPALASRLANQPSTSAPAKVVAPILANIGDVTAATAVVSWLQGQTEDASPLIQDLVVQRTRTEQMLAAWSAALDPAVSFRNEQNREAIRAALAVYRAGRTLER